MYPIQKSYKIINRFSSLHKGNFLNKAKEFKPLEKGKNPLITRLNRIATKMHSENFSSLVLDTKHKISICVPQVQHSLHNYHYIILRNTGLNSYESMLSFLDTIGMTSERAFDLGGRTSSSKQQKWVYLNRIRHLDFYPGNHYLLPNPECQYMALFPQYIVFYCPKNFDEKKGGRTFIHGVKAIENYLSQYLLGRNMLEDIRKYNLKITTGFLEKNHPCKHENYFKSIEERFGHPPENAQEMIEEGKLIEEFFEGCVLHKEGGKILQASITIPGFRKFQGEFYLNLPRIALTPPSIQNGYREYTLGNNRLLTNEENLLLLEAYLYTREEVKWKQGDLAIFNNITHVHSKEPHDYEEWPIVVAMDGVAFSDLLIPQQKDSLRAKFKIKEAQLDPLKKPNQSNGAAAFDSMETDKPRYQMPQNKQMWNELIPMRVFDAKEQLNINHPNRSVILQQIFTQFKKYGLVHVINAWTSDPIFDEETLASLGFSKNEIFQWGGKISGRTYRIPLEHYGKYGFFSVDSYPADKVLLPHNEIYYQHDLPRRILFFYVNTLPEGNGGRTFFHSSELVEKYIASKGETGTELLKDMRERGMYIESGFADENDPDAQRLYTRTWQDRFGTKDIEEALKLIEKSPIHFDKGWVREEGKKNGRVYYTVMTSITVPCFNIDNETQKNYLMFPRVSYNGPTFENGYRSYKWGSKDGDQGKPLCKNQIQLLIDAYFETRLGCYQKPGDFIIFDNLLYSHSRESFDPSNARCSGVLMAGSLKTRLYKEKV